MKLLTDILLLFKRRLMETLRQPVWIISGLMTPLLYIALFSPLLISQADPPTTSAVLNGFVPGVLSLLAFGAGMGSGWIIVDENHSGMIERLRVTPVSRFAIVMGGVLKDILTFLIPAVLVILVSSFFGFHINIAGIIVLLLLLSLLTAVVSAWSASLGLLLGEIGSLAAVITSLQLPLTLLSGVLLPLSSGPRWLQVLAHVNPMYYTVEASRKLASGVIFSKETMAAFIVMVSLTILVLCWSTHVFKKSVA